MPTSSTYSSREASTTTGRSGLRVRVSIADCQIGAAVWAVIRPSSTRLTPSSVSDPVAVPVDIVPPSSTPLASAAQRSGDIVGPGRGRPQMSVVASQSCTASWRLNYAAVMESYQKAQTSSGRRESERRFCRLAMTGVIVIGAPSGGARRALPARYARGGRSRPVWTETRESCPGSKRGLDETAAAANETGASCIHRGFPR